jgi:hypothetical protein
MEKPSLSSKLIIFTYFTEQNFKEQTYKERTLTSLFFSSLSFGEGWGEAKFSFFP